MIVTVIRTAMSQWSAQGTGRIGAALAYYSVFSLGPLLLIVTSIAGLFFGRDAVRGSLIAELRSLIGNTGAQAVEAMLVGASSEQSARSAALVGTILLLAAGAGCRGAAQGCNEHDLECARVEGCRDMVVCSHLPHFARRNFRLGISFGGFFDHQRGNCGALGHFSQCDDGRTDQLRGLACDFCSACYSSGSPMRTSTGKTSSLGLWPRLCSLTSVSLRLPGTSERKVWSPPTALQLQS